MKPKCCPQPAKGNCVSALSSALLSMSRPGQRSTLCTLFTEHLWKITAHTCILASQMPLLNPNRWNTLNRGSQRQLNQVYILHGTCNLLLLFQSMPTLNLPQANWCPELRLRKKRRGESMSYLPGCHTASGNYVADDSICLIHITIFTSLLCRY